MELGDDKSFENCVGESVPLPLLVKLALRGIQCWRPKGQVSVAFRELFPTILEVSLCNRGFRPQTEDVYLGCYMLGFSPRTAVPYISFASRDPKPRKELRKLVQVEVLPRHPGWKTVDWNQDPGTRHTVPCGMTGLNEEEPTRLLVQSSASSLAGSKIFASSSTGPADRWQNVSTGGGIVSDDDGHCYIMTTAHSLPGYTGPELSFPQLEGDFEFDMDDLPEDEEPLLSTGSRTPEPARQDSTDHQSSPSSSSGDDQLATPHQDHLHDTILVKESSSTPNLSDRREQQASVIRTRSVGPTSLQVEDFHSNLDYTLIRLDEDDLQNPFQANNLQANNLQAIGTLTQPESCDVVVNTSSGGLIRGHLEETPFYIFHHGASRTQELWTITSDKDILQGDSGAWVIDPSNMRLIGSVVAASGETNSALLVPAFLVFDELLERLHIDCHALIDVSSFRLAIRDLETREQASAAQEHHTQLAAEIEAANRSNSTTHAFEACLDHLRTYSKGREDYEAEYYLKLVDNVGKMIRMHMEDDDHPTDVLDKKQQPADTTDKGKQIRRAHTTAKKYIKPELPRPRKLEEISPFPGAIKAEHKQGNMRTDSVSTIESSMALDPEASIKMSDEDGLGSTTTFLPSEPHSAGGAIAPAKFKPHHSLPTAADATKEPAAGPSTPRVTVRLWDGMIAGNPGLKRSQEISETMRRNRSEAPSARRPFGDLTNDFTPSIAELTRSREADGRNNEVDKWMHNLVAVGSPKELNPFELWDLERTRDGHDDGIPLGDSTENRLVPGQTYFDDAQVGERMLSDDADILADDWPKSGTGPRFAAIQMTHEEPESSQDAISRFDRLCRDNESFISRQASWGTLRRPDDDDPHKSNDMPMVKGSMFYKLVSRKERPSRLENVLPRLRARVDWPRPRWAKRRI